MRRKPGSNQHSESWQPLPVTPPPVVDAPPLGAVAPMAATAPSGFSGRVEGRDLSGAVLTGATFEGAARHHAGRFDRADVGGHQAVFGVFTSCSWRDAKAAAANLDGLHVGSDFSGAQLTWATLPSSEDCSYRDADLRFASAMRRSCDGCDFTGADLTGMRFTGVTFRGALLDGADGFDTVAFRHCVYDDATRFPVGYRPRAHGWVYGPLDPDAQQQRADALAAARDGGELPGGTA